MTRRILEVGQFRLLARAFPESTASLLLRESPDSTGAAPSGREEVARRLEELRAGSFDVVVLLPPGHAPLSGIPGIARRAGAALRRSRHPFTRAVDRVLAAARGVPIAVLDMDDPSSISPRNGRLLEACTLYFKRELPRDTGDLLRRVRRPAWALRDDTGWRRSIAAKLRPISTGLPAETLDGAPATPVPKRTDVFFSGTIWADGPRSEGLDALRRLSAQGLVVDLPGRLPRAEYLARCAQARLTWSPPGLGHECFRHLEAPLCGSVPILETAFVVRHRPLEDGVHAFFHERGPEALARVILHALERPERLDEMAAAARRHVLAHHTHEALGRHVVDETFAAAGGSDPGR